MTGGQLWATSFKWAWTPVRAAFGRPTMALHELRHFCAAGFTMHAIFKVWQDILADEQVPQSHLFTMDSKPARCYEYVRDKVFGIDFDEKSRQGRSLR